MKVVTVKIAWMMMMLTFSGEAISGSLLSAGANWNDFVFEPLAQEDTPNFYGYGLRVNAGYSVAQMLDFALYAHYAPGHLYTPSMISPDAYMFDIGGEVAFRIFGVFYAGVRGGQWTYHLIHNTVSGELSGTWQGLGGSASFGIIAPVSKRTSWQASMDVGQGTLSNLHPDPADPSAKKRRLSRVSITVGIVYNGFRSSTIEDAVLGSFMKSIF